MRFAWRGYDLYNLLSRHRKLNSVQLHLFWGTLIQEALLTELPRRRQIKQLLNQSGFEPGSRTSAGTSCCRDVRAVSETKTVRSTWLPNFLRNYFSVFAKPGLRGCTDASSPRPGSKRSSPTPIQSTDAWSRSGQPVSVARHRRRPPRSSRCWKIGTKFGF